MSRTTKGKKKQQGLNPSQEPPPVTSQPVHMPPPVMSTPSQPQDIPPPVVSTPIQPQDTPPPVNSKPVHVPPPVVTTSSQPLDLPPPPVITQDMELERERQRLQELERQRLLGWQQELKTRLADLNQRRRQAQSRQRTLGSKIDDLSQKKFKLEKKLARMKGLSQSVRRQRAFLATLPTSELRGLEFYQMPMSLDQISLERANVDINGFSIHVIKSESAIVSLQQTHDTLVDDIAQLEKDIHHREETLAQHQETLRKHQQSIETLQENYQRFKESIIELQQEVNSNQIILSEMLEEASPAPLQIGPCVAFIDRGDIDSIQTMVISETYTQDYLTDVRLQLDELAAIIKKAESRNRDLKKQQQTLQKQNEALLDNIQSRKDKIEGFQTLTQRHQQQGQAALARIKELNQLIDGLSETFETQERSYGELGIPPESKPNFATTQLPQQLEAGLSTIQDYDVEQIYTDTYISETQKDVDRHQQTIKQVLSIIRALEGQQRKLSKVINTRASDLQERLAEQDREANYDKHLALLQGEGEFDIESLKALQPLSEPIPRFQASAKQGLPMIGSTSLLHRALIQNNLVLFELCLAKGYLAYTEALDKKSPLYILVASQALPLPYLEVLKAKQWFKSYDNAFSQALLQRFEDINVKLSQQVNVEQQAVDQLFLLADWHQRQKRSNSQGVIQRLLNSSLMSQTNHQALCYKLAYHYAEVNRQGISDFVHADNESTLLKLAITHSESLPQTLALWYPKPTTALYRALQSADCLEAFKTYLFQTQLGQALPVDELDGPLLQLAIDLSLQGRPGLLSQCLVETHQAFVKNFLLGTHESTQQLSVPNDMNIVVVMAATPALFSPKEKREIFSHCQSSHLSNGYLSLREKLDSYGHQSKLKFETLYAYSMSMIEKAKTVDTILDFSQFIESLHCQMPEKGKIALLKACKNAILAKLLESQDGQTHAREDEIQTFLQSARKDYYLFGCLWIPDCLISASRPSSKIYHEIRQAHRDTAKAQLQTQTDNLALEESDFYQSLKA